MRLDFCDNGVRRYRENRLIPLSAKGTGGGGCLIQDPEQRSKAVTSPPTAADHT